MSHRIAFRTLVVTALLLIGVTYGHAAEVGKVTHLEGQADLIRDAAPPRPLKVSDAILEHDTLSTGSGSSLEVTMRDGSRLTLSENTRSEIIQYATDAQPAGLVEVVRGHLRAFVTDFFSSRRDSFRVRTPTAVVGVQGTNFALIVLELWTRLIVYQGVVNAMNVNPAVQGSQTLRQNQTTIIRKDKPPEPPQFFGSSASAFGLFTPFEAFVGTTTLIGVGTGIVITSVDDKTSLTPSVPPDIEP